MMFEILAQGLEFPESPIWSQQDGCFYLVEWTGNRVLILRDDRVETLFSTGPGSGPSGICQDIYGDLWVCLYDGLKVARFNRAGEQLQEINGFLGRPFRGPCDIVADGQGGVFFTDSGDFDEDWRSGRPAGAVYAYHPQGDLIQVDRELCFPNGIALSVSGDRLYVNEHRRNRSLLYDISSLEAGLLQGTLAPNVFFEYDLDCLLEPKQEYELGPDGVCVDGTDNLWVAHYGGGKVFQISPSGALLSAIHLPRGRLPTNVAVSPDLSFLLVTEAEYGLLYRVRLDL